GGRPTDSWSWTWSWTRRRRGVSERQLPFDAAVESAARSVLGSEDADPAPIAHLVGAVSEVHDRGPNLDRAAFSEFDSLPNPDIDLNVGKEISSVGEAS